MRASARGFLPALVLVLLIASASIARASGFDLAWDNCVAGAGSSARTSTCQSDFGTQFAVGSFMLTRDLPAFVGVEAIVEVRAESSTLPDWWSFFNQGSCRINALSASFAFHTFADGCVDPWEGQAFGGVAAYHTVDTSPSQSGGYPNAARIVIGGALPRAAHLSAGTDYYAFQLVISNVKTTGNVCSGCRTPACITVLEMKAVQQDGSAERMTVPLHSERVGWQGASSCESSVQNRSWGQVKNLYR